MKHPVAVFDFKNDVAHSAHSARRLGDNAFLAYVTHNEVQVARKFRNIRECIGALGQCRVDIRRTHSVDLFAINQDRTFGGAWADFDVAVAQHTNRANGCNGVTAHASLDAAVDPHGDVNGSFGTKLGEFNFINSANFFARHPNRRARQEPLHIIEVRMNLVIAHEQTRLA